MINVFELASLKKIMQILKKMFKNKKNKINFVRLATHFSEIKMLSKYTK